MTRKLFTLALLFACTTYCVQAQCGTCSQTWNGTDNNIPNITSGTFCITSGNFKGSMNGIAAGATLCVSSGATFNPSSLNGDYEGSMQLYGISNLPTLTVASNFFLKGYTKVVFTGDINFNGSNASFSNAAGSVMIFNNNLPLNGNGTSLSNNGYIRINGDFNTQANTTVNNRGDLRLAGGFNPSGVVVNNGLISASGIINLNSGSDITNNCRFISVEGFNNNDNLFTNNGIVWVTGANKQIQNNGGATIALGPQSSFRGSNFMNNGTVTGSGVCYFTGTTTQQGTFTGTSSNQQINFYDATQSNSSNFFDNQNTAPSNAKRLLPVPLPDTIYFGPCTDPTFINLAPPTLLPIVLKSFAVASSSTPYTAFWEVENISDIRNFTLEQSLNGVDFYSIAQETTTGNNYYSYQLSSTTSFSSFYRLKLVGKDGKIIYSQIVKTGKDKKNDIGIKNVVGNSQIWLTSNLEKSQQAKLLLYNAIGQLVFTKNLNLIAGNQQSLLDIPAQIKGLLTYSVKTTELSSAGKVLIP